MGLFSFINLVVNFMQQIPISNYINFSNFKIIKSFSSNFIDFDFQNDFLIASAYHKDHKKRLIFYKVFNVTTLIRSYFILIINEVRWSNFKKSIAIYLKIFLLHQVSFLFDFTDLSCYTYFISSFLSNFIC
jgi:hypothetical protein